MMDIKYRLVGKVVNGIILSVFAMVAFFACGKGGHASYGVGGDAGEEVNMKYAEHLVIREHPGFTEVTVKNPWDTVKILHRYILVDKDSVLPANLPKGTLIRTPLRNALVYSTVHNSLLAELGAMDAVGGVCDSEYQSGEIRDRLSKGKIVDCGLSQNPDMEKIIRLHPEAIMLSPYENSGQYAKVEKLGIPIIECADYMETSALGRAEWVKLYGLLFGKGEESRKMFSDTESKYMSLKNKAVAVKSLPKVLLDQVYGQTWGVPAKGSTMSKIIEDAGGINPFASYNESGSVQLSPEKVLAMASDADVWFVRYYQESEKTLRELSNDAPVNSQFKAFKNGNVYGCNTRYVNFYDEVPFHPERLLEDMIAVMHPELNVGGEKENYYSKMR